MQAAASRNPVFVDTSCPRFSTTIEHSDAWHVDTLRTRLGPEYVSGWSPSQLVMADSSQPLSNLQAYRGAGVLLLTWLTERQSATVNGLLTGGGWSGDTASIERLAERPGAWTAAVLTADRQILAIRPRDLPQRTRIVPVVGGRAVPATDLEVSNDVDSGTLVALDSTDAVFVGARVRADGPAAAQTVISRMHVACR
jgi:hypothetical protein